MDNKDVQRAPDEDSSAPVIADAVLVISGDGTICSVLSGPDGSADNFATEFQGSPVERFWPADFATTVRRNVKRTLRSRDVHSDEFDDSIGGGCYESIFVAQGTDRVLVVVRDISDQKATLTKIEDLAYIDSVTRLPNREHLLKELSIITDMLRLKGGRAAVICFDIDQHYLTEYSSAKEKQNEILQALATRLIDGLRGANHPKELDTERYSVAARVDFRQFAVVLPDIESGTDVANVTERLSDSLQQPIKIGTREFTVKVSAGISLFPQDGTDALTLYENAFSAMHDAVSNDSAHYEFHSGTLNVPVLKRQDLEAEMRAALEREEFEVHYLPIVQAVTHKVTTVEALLRWPQAVFGSKPVRYVVSLAEQTGLIVPIGEWVLRHSCEQLKKWHMSGHPDLRLAINLSMQEFSRADLIQRIKNILVECSIDPQCLDVEIAERLVLRDAMNKFSTTREFRELGVRVVVDDYGTGVCSLGHLSRSLVDAVKIDCSLVEHSGTNQNDRAACAAAIAMAHELGMEVVAEGVETKDHAVRLQELGCDFLQGFLFTRPAPATEITDYLDGVAASSKSI